MEIASFPKCLPQQQNYHVFVDLKVLVHETEKAEYGYHEKALSMVIQGPLINTHLPISHMSPRNPVC